MDLRINAKYRAATSDTLDSFLRSIEEFKQQGNYRAIIGLLPFIEDSLRVTAQSPNADLARSYSERFGRVLPNYDFSVVV